MELSRRELVAAFLGLSLAQVGCRKTQPRPWPGALVDRAVALGHRLHQTPLPLASSLEPLEVAIVGGGIAGLSAAWRLAAAGVKKLVVLDLEEDLGGTSRSGRNRVGAFPWGAHYLPAPREDAGPVPRLLRELGVLEGVEDDGTLRFAEQVLIREPEERLFYRGAWYEGLYLRAGASAEDLAQLRRFEAQTQALSSARDGQGRKAFDVPVDRGSDDAEWAALDRLSMAQWLEQQRYTSPRLRWWVDYACRDDFGTTADRVSAYAGLWYFCARADGERRPPGYLSWPEGNGRLVAALAASVPPGARRTTSLVHGLTPVEGGCRIDALDGATGQPHGFLARQVVLAAPRFVAARVLTPWQREPPAWLREFEYGPWVVANLTLNALPEGRGYPLAWDNVLYESRSLGYVHAGHQAERADESGPAVWTWYYPLDGDPRAERERLLSASYPDWEAVVRADLVRAHPDLDRHVQRLEVMRWGHAMVRPRPGFMFGAARKAAAKPVAGVIHMAHTDLGGMALFEEACFYGVRAAEAALAGLGRGGPSWL